MIIDFHTHTFPAKIAKGALDKLSADSHSIPALDGTEESLMASMKEAGIDYSVVLPVVTNPVKASSMNQKAAALNEKTAETGIISFGGIHPETPNYKEVLKEAKELGLKGIKLHPDYYAINFDDIRMMRVIDEVSNQGMATITHAGTDIGLYPPVCCTPDMVVRVMDEVKPEKMILAHMGGWQMWDQVAEKLVSKNIYIDTAFSIQSIPWREDLEPKAFRMMTDEEFVKLVRLFGSDRVLFATDSPWAGQKDYVEHIKSLGFTEEELENIFHKTAEKFL